MASYKRLSGLVTLFVFLLFARFAVAVPLPGDLDISGSILVNSDASYAESGAVFEGDVTLIAAGTDDTTTYNHITGFNAYSSDSLTMIGDGVRFDGYGEVVNRGNLPGVQIGDEVSTNVMVNMNLDIKNLSLTDTWKVTLYTWYSSLANSSHFPGNENVAANWFEISGPNGDIYTNDAVSANPYGNLYNGTPTGSTGGQVWHDGLLGLSSYEMYFDVLLNPGEMLDIYGDFETYLGATLNAQGGGDASTLFAGSIEIHDVMLVSAVPEPATLLLLGFGLAGLGFARKSLH